MFFFKRDNIYRIYHVRVDIGDEIIDGATSSSGFAEILLRNFHKFGLTVGKPSEINELPLK